MKTEQWDEFWRSRDRRLLGHLLRWGRRRFVTRRMVQFLLCQYTARGTLVEAGCGTGEVAFEVARQRGDRVVLVDLSAEALRTARERFDRSGIQVRTLQCDIVALSEALPRIDDGTVFNIGVIEHFSDCREVLQQMAAVAGRKALAIVPARSLFWATFIALSRRLRLVPKGFLVLLYDEAGLRTAVHRADLHVVDVKQIRIAGLIPYLAVEFHS